MELVEVNSKSTIKSFHNLPYKIYKGNKIWVPHLKQDIEFIFNKKKNKQLRNGKAIRWILLNNNHKVIGRVSAFVNKRMMRGEVSAGGIGFFVPGSYPEYPLL